MNIKSATKRLPSGNGLTALLTGDAISQIGSGISSFALMWWIMKETGSTAKTGAVMAISFGAVALFGFWVGKIVDRAVSKRLVMLISDVLNAAVVGVMAILIISHHADIWTYYVLVFIKAILGIPTVACRRALMNKIVSAKASDRASALITFGTKGSACIGPLVGGLVITHLGVGATLGIDAFTYILAGACRLAIPKPSAEYPALREMRANSTFLGTIRYLAQTKTVLWVFAIVSAIQLFMASFGMVLVVFVQNELGHGPDTLGAVHSALLVAVLTGSAFVFARGLPGRSRRMLLVLAFETIAISLLLLGTFKTVPSLFAMAVLFGLAESIINAIVETLLIRKVDANRQGRVTVLVTGLHSCLTPLSVWMAVAIMSYSSAAAFFQIAAVGVAGTSILFFLVPGLGNSNSTDKPQRSELAR